MDLGGGWRIGSIRSISAFGGEDKDTDTALRFAYESLPPQLATPDAPLASACAASSGAPDDGVDRISSLPDVILRNIVSRLPAKGRRAHWRSRPALAETASGARCPSSSSTPTSSRDAGANPLWQPGLEDTLSVTNDVSYVLAAHPGPFRCVQITCCYLDLTREKVDGWLQLVADKGIQELAFINRPWPLDIPLPTTLFSCTSLTRLHIGAWKFPNTAALTRTATFPHLQELFLSLITMKNRDLAFLFDTSPVLEVLTIIASQTDVRLHLVSRTLRCLQLGLSSLGDMAVADAPLLERLFLVTTRSSSKYL